jgi:hypothetical protein
LRNWPLAIETSPFVPKVHEANRKLTLQLERQ